MADGEQGDRVERIDLQLSCFTSSPSGNKDGKDGQAAADRSASHLIYNYYDN